MKMKFTLLAAVVAMAGAQVEAQVFTKIVEPTEDMTRLLTPSNSTSVQAKKLPGIAVPAGGGTTDHKNILIQGEELKDNVYGKYGPDGETIGVYADGSSTFLKFRYNTANKGRNGESRLLNAVKKEVPNGYTTAYVKFMVGPKPADATSDVLTPRIEIVSVADTENGDATYTMTYSFPEITLTDETQVFELDMTGSATGDYFNEDGTVKQVKTNYIDFYLDGVTTGQFASYQGLGFANFFTPKVGFDSAGTRHIGFWGDMEVEPGTIFIQAEDFDGYKEGEEPTYSPVCTSIDLEWKDGYGYTCAPSANSHWTKGDLSNIRIDIANGKTGGYGLFQQCTGEISSTNDGFALIGMSRMDGEWGTNYGGEYLDETSNKISLEQAMDGFGSWFEYTFEMEEDGYVDISVAACAHAATSFLNVLQGGTMANENVYYTKYQKPREEGGYEVEGLDDDFLKLYGFCYVLSMDGEELRTNWEGRPAGNRRTGAIEPDKWVNPLSWSDTREDDGNGNLVNSKFLLITPPYPHWDGEMWWPLYKSELVNRWYSEQVTNDAGEQVDSAFKTQCDELGADYFELNYKNRPDYIDIPCTAGKHTIRVKSMGGSTIFDELKITAHKERKSSGIENLAAKRVAEEFAGEAEYFDLQGRKVVNPANGIYIVKRGTQVTKEVVR